MWCWRAKKKAGTFSDAWNQKNRWQERIPNRQECVTNWQEQILQSEKWNSNENSRVQKVRNWNCCRILQNSKRISEPSLVMSWAPWELSSLANITKALQITRPNPSQCIPIWNPLLTCYRTSSVCVCVCVFLSSGRGGLPSDAVPTARRIHPPQCLQCHTPVRHPISLSLRRC